MHATIEYLGVNGRVKLLSNFQTNLWSDFGHRADYRFEISDCGIKGFRCRVSGVREEKQES